MLTMGIDIGSHLAKGVLFNNGKIVSSTRFRINEDPFTVYERILNELKVPSDAGIDKIALTGVGGQFLSDRYIFFPELQCHTKGIAADYPSARTVIVIGAENFNVGKIDENGNLVDFGTNDKCAAGSGIFVEEMAGALDIDLTEMGELSTHATQDINMSATCSVFAESEVVSMNHKKIPKEDISRAILKSIATRIISLVKRVSLEEDVVVSGGCANNIGLVKLLKELLMCPVVVPEDPDMTAAIGAALLAQE